MGSVLKSINNSVFESSKIVKVCDALKDKDFRNKKTQNLIFPKFVKEGSACVYTCDKRCNKFDKRQTCSHRQSDPGVGQNVSFIKRQTCFNCGIARNFPYRPYVPFYGHGQRNLLRSTFNKLNSNNSRHKNASSSDGD